MHVEHYETPLGSELVDRIRLAHRPYRFYTLFSLKLSALQVGDVVHAHSQFEVTNDYEFNVMVAHAMMLHQRETIVSYVDRFPDGEFVMPCRPAGENVTPGMHHGYRTLAGSLKAKWAGDAWLTVLIYSASDASGPDSWLTVHKEYGGLSALVYHGAGRTKR